VGNEDLTIAAVGEGKMFRIDGGLLVTCKVSVAVVVVVVVVTVVVIVVVVTADVGASVVSTR